MLKTIFAKEVTLKLDVNDVLSKITKKTKIIFIANPNNPTGSYLNKKELDVLIKKTPKRVVIVLDLAYAEFVEADDYTQALDLVDKNENVVVTRTFSKIHGLASLRIGWSYSSPYVAGVLNRMRGPFNVTSAAQSAAVASIKDGKFLKKSIEHNNKWVKIIRDKLREVDIKTYPSAAKFSTDRPD